jgi:integrase/recombinase XerD
MGIVRDRMSQDLVMAGYAAGTREHYLGAASRFVRRFMRSPEQMGQEELRLHVAELGASGISPGTLKVELAALKFLYAKTLGRPSEVAWISWPRQPRALPRVLSRDEVLALLDAAPSPLYRAIMLVMYGAGLRVGEAVALQVRDIDAARRIIRITRGKGAKPREVALDAKLLAALREYWRKTTPPLPYLFAGPRSGRPVAPKSVRTAIRRAARRAGLRKRVTPHMLRHSFATALLEMGTDIRVIQHLLGHACITSTMFYTRVDAQLVMAVRSPLHRLPGVTDVTDED